MEPSVSGVQWLPMPPGERELLEELGHPLFVFALVRVDLGVGPFEIDRRQDARCAVAGAGEKDGIEVVLVDQPIEVDVREAQAGARGPSARADAA